MWFSDGTSTKSRRSGKNNFRDYGRRHILNVNARAEKSDKAHKIGAIVLLLIALSGMVWVAMFGVRAIGSWLFSQNDFFTVKQVEISSNGRLQPSHIREYAGIAEGMNLFDVSLPDIRKNLEKVPLVKSVRVERILPDKLVVTVKERSAVARIGQDDRQFFLAVDREGYVLGPTSRSPNLPAISGLRDHGLTPGSLIQDPAVSDALLAIDLCEAAGIMGSVRLASIDVRHQEYLDMRLATGHRILLSRLDMKRKLEDLSDIIRKNAEIGKVWTVADLTVERNYPVQ